MSIKGAAGTALQGQASTFECILLKGSPPVSLSWQKCCSAQDATTLRGTTEPGHAFPRGARDILRLRTPAHTTSHCTTSLSGELISVHLLQWSLSQHLDVSGVSADWEEGWRHLAQLFLLHVALAVGQVTSTVQVCKAIS